MSFKDIKEAVASLSLSHKWSVSAHVVFHRELSLLGLFLGNGEKCLYFAVHLHQQQQIIELSVALELRLRVAKQSQLVLQAKFFFCFFGYYLTVSIFRLSAVTRPWLRDSCLTTFSEIEEWSCGAPP